MFQKFSQKVFIVTNITGYGDLTNRSRDRMDSDLAFNETRYKTCPDCGEKFPSSHEMVTHCGRRHQERVTAVLNKFGVKKTLEPVKRCVEPRKMGNPLDCQKKLPEKLRSPKCPF